jgi:hypothetical protein
MTAMTCTELHDVAAELALGVLNGRERSNAIEHLDRCTPCRSLVSSMSQVTDDLLRLFAPSVEPPASFEDRVLAAIAPPPARPDRRRRLATLAWAACIAVFVWAFGTGDATPQAVAAEMRTVGGDPVGWIYVDGRDTARLSMSLPEWQEQLRQYGDEQGSDFSLRITDEAGASRVVSITLDRHAMWTGTFEIDPSSIRSAAVIDDQGYVWCHADLRTA